MLKPEGKNFIDYTDKVKKDKATNKEEINRENDNKSNHQISKSNILINSTSNSNNKFNPEKSMIFDNFTSQVFNFPKINFDENNLYFNYHLFQALFKAFNSKQKIEILKELSQELSEDLLIPKKLDDDLSSINKSISNNIIKNNNDISFGLNDTKYIQKQQSKNGILPPSEDFLKLFSRQNILKSLTEQCSTIYLQKQLETISRECIDYIIAELKGIFREIIKDKNENYFVMIYLKNVTKYKE